jgi:DNA repair protein RecO (recombination protein O)
MLKLEQAYVLESKPYRESSALVRLFSQESGVFAGVLKGVYQPGRKAQQLRAALQFAAKVDVQYQFAVQQGLVKIYQLDLLHSAPQPNPKAYLYVSYLNELLRKLIPEGANVARLFLVYEQLVAELLQANDDVAEVFLRRFEYHLLQEIGLEFDWQQCYRSGAEITACGHYSFDIDHGFAAFTEASPQSIRGSDIISIYAGDFSELACRQQAKRIFRRLIQKQLGGRSLQTRALYRELFPR